jgi:hypothetical protein
MSWATRAWRGAKGFAKDVGHDVYETGEMAYDGVHDAVWGAPAPVDNGGIVETDPNAYGSGASDVPALPDGPAASNGVGGDSVLGPDARSALDDPLVSSDPTQTTGQKVATGISSVLSAVNNVVPLDDLLDAAIE